jgi:hypothetical protein
MKTDPWSVRICSGHPIYILHHVFRNVCHSSAAEIVRTKLAQVNTVVDTPLLQCRRLVVLSLVQRSKKRVENPVYICFPFRIRRAAGRALIRCTARATARALPRCTAASSIFDYVTSSSGICPRGSDCISSWTYKYV